MFGNLFGGESPEKPVKSEEDRAINNEINKIGEGIIDDARDIIIETVNYFSGKNQNELIKRMSLRDFLDEIKNEKSSFDKKIEAQIQIWINGHKKDIDFDESVESFLMSISHRIDEYEEMVKQEEEE